MTQSWLFASTPSFVHESAKGRLQSVSVSSLDIPLRRIYWICLNDLSWRGFHAHKNLHQVFFVQSGNLEFFLDDGNGKKRIELHSTESIKIYPGVWREFRSLSPQSVLLVLASEEFDESDYIRNYDEFRRYVNGFS